MAKYAQVIYINDYKNFTTNLTKEYIKERLKKLDKLSVYEYRIPTNMKIKKSDLCLVDANNSFNVVYVINVSTEAQYSGNIKMLYSKLDLKAYQDELEKTERLKQLEQKIDEMYKKVSKIQVLKSVAKDNKEMQKLLDEYEKLGD